MGRDLPRQGDQEHRRRCPAHDVRVHRPLRSWPWIGTAWHRVIRAGRVGMACPPKGQTIGGRAAWGREALDTHGLVRLSEGLAAERSEEHTSELQSLMRISYAVFCLKKKREREI